MGISLDDIQASYHSIKISDGTNTLDLTTSPGNIGIHDDGNSITVDGTVELGATTLSALESITVQNGAGAAAVNIQDGGNSITVDAVNLDIRDLAFATDSVTAHQGGVWTMSVSPDAFSTWKTTTQTVTTTAAELASTPLTSRDHLIVQNLGANDVFVGATGAVTTSTGLKIPKGSSLEIALADDADMFALTASSTADVRIAEFAA